MTYNASDLEVTPTDWVPENSIIKVIGVGGGGCNAVNYMYNKRIEGCSFIVCNTDKQSLDKSPVPIKIQLGSGLGAGCNPTEGRNAAINSQKEIEEKVLDTKTDMLFITAGMGGGTGTGAAPVIASMAKNKGILTVGVVTLPFKNEGNESLSKAIDGIYELQKNVDSLLIINNEKIYTHYGSLLIQEAFPKTDEVLATAVRGITEIIKKRGYINVDFKDVSTMMRNDNRSGSRYALMGCGTGTGKNRIEDAVKSALESPLLNDFDLNTAQKVLINVTTGSNKEGLTMSEYGEVSAMIQKYTGKADNFKSGLIFDESPEFGDRVNITVIVTGINMTMALPQTEIGNIIMIDSSFRYERHKAASEEGIELPQVKVHKIGYNSAPVRKKLVFDRNNRPALLVSEEQDRSELENVSALRRKALPGQNREEL